MTFPVPDKYKADFKIKRVESVIDAHLAELSKEISQLAKKIEYDHTDIDIAFSQDTYRQAVVTQRIAILQAKYEALSGILAAL